MPNTVMVGEITQVNSKNDGIKLDVTGDAWRDWSKWAEGKRPALSKGMRVRVELDNKDFIRKVTGAGGEALPPKDDDDSGTTAGVGSSGSGRGFTQEDSWRMTLLSAISSASNIIPRLISPEGKVGEGGGALSPSVATYNLGLFLAKKAWAEPMPPMPEKPDNTTAQ